MVQVNNNTSFNSEFGGYSAAALVAEALLKEMELAMENGQLNSEVSADAANLILSKAKEYKDQLYSQAADQFASGVANASGEFASAACSIGAGAYSGSKISEMSSADRTYNESTEGIKTLEDKVNEKTTTTKLSTETDQAATNKEAQTTRDINSKEWIKNPNKLANMDEISESQKAKMLEQLKTEKDTAERAKSEAYQKANTKSDLARMFAQGIGGALDATGKAVGAGFQQEATEKQGEAQITQTQEQLIQTLRQTIMSAKDANDRDMQNYDQMLIALQRTEIQG